MNLKELFLRVAGPLVGVKPIVSIGAEYVTERGARVSYIKEAVPQDFSGDKYVIYNIQNVSGCRTITTPEKDETTGQPIIFSKEGAKEHIRGFEQRMGLLLPVGSPHPSGVK